MKNTLKCHKKIFQKIELNGKIYHLGEKKIVYIIKMSVLPK